MPPTLLSLPSKLLQAIADQVSFEHDLNALTQSHPRLDEILTPYIRARKDRQERSKLLIFAIKSSKPPQLSQLLLRDGADQTVRVEMEQGKTALHFAAETGQTVVARVLLAHQRSLLDIRDGIGRTPLMCAAKGGHEAVVRTLRSTKYGPADVALRDCKKRSALWYAAHGGNVTIVQMLLDTGKLDPNSADSDGLTPFAYCRTHIGKTPLYLAAGKRREKAVHYLLALSREGRVDPDSRTVFGETPLRAAAMGGHPGVVQQLLGVEGVNPDPVDQLHRTPLIVAALYGHAEVVQLLLATGKVQLNARDKSGMTPLMWAAKCRRIPVVKLFLSTGQVQVDFDLRELRKGASLFGLREESDLPLLELLNAYKRDNS
ncbi:hypothetical protein HFD88_002414 [Aspergillus terreus]|nr:hypothetical protein HFD88_002414 [Aspergillus terreus]